MFFSFTCSYSQMLSVIMENPKTPETLEAKIPDLELLEEASESPDLLTLNESSNGLGSIFGLQLQENGNAVGESLAIDVKENGVSVIETDEGCLLHDGVAKMKEDHVGVGVDTGIVDNAVVEPKTKEDDLSGTNGVDSVKMVQVSGDNISLYVDFLGTPNEVNSTELMTRKSKLPEAGNEELMIEREEHKFYVGDIVWINTKSQSWWPGKIFDPSELSKYALDGDKKNCLLVGYFASNHVVWCCPSQLKPFHLNFDQMIGHNKARSFLGAVEKAVEDLGKCLKLEMTCSCIRKEDCSTTKEGASMLEHKSGQLGEFSAARFEPVKFLSQLKNLAQVVSNPDMLEFVVLQNYLSAFYCSIGHCQLPLHQLWETTNDAENNAGLAEENSIIYKFSPKQSNVMKNETLQLNQNLGAFPESCGDITAGEGVISSKQASTSRKRKRKIQSSIPFEGPDQRTCVSVENGNDNSELKNEMGFDLRERKKSKYLSYPYVNVENKVSNETGDPITSKVSPHEEVNEFIGSTSADKRTAKRFQKTWYTKFIRGNDVTAYPELTNSSSAELLSELRFLAVDCLFPTESKTFGLIEWFFSRFRISAYHDESVYEMNCKNMANQKEIIGTDPCLSGNDPQLTVPKTKAQKKRKVTNSATSNTKSPSGKLDGNFNLKACNLSVKESQGMTSEAPGGKQTNQETKEAINIPDLNGNGAIPPTPSLFVANGNDASSRSFLIDFQVTGSHSIKTTDEQSKREGLNVSLPDSGQTIVSESKSGKKKRGRKLKVPSDHQNPMLTLNIPDLNGTSMEPSLLIKDLQESNSVSPAVKPPRKRRRRRKGETSLGSPNLILNYNVAGASGKPFATTLLLTFTPGSSMPSKEVLISTFCRFGTLKESELQILKDSNSARVVFMRSKDAGKALRSLEESNPFGETLMNYNLQTDTIVTSVKLSSPTPRLADAPPPKLSGSMPRLGDAPPIDVMKQNLEMMTSMLLKSGDNLSPEMRAKLESEINGLLKKVSSCPGSSS